MNISTLLQKIVDWLAAHRFINLLLITAYFLFIYFMHDPVVHLSVWVMNFFTLAVYNKVVIAVIILFLILFIVFLVSRLKEHRDNFKLKIIYLVITLAVIIIHFRIMFEMNIEIIHIFEFPVLAFLLFPLTRRFGATVFFTIPFMLLDEWHQYIVLYPATVDYLELNDVVMDIYGAALALISLLICGVKGQKEVKPLFKRTEFISLFVCLLLIIIAVKLCFVSIYATGKCDNTLLVLNRIPGAHNFWRQYPGREVIYHVMQPVEAFIFIPLVTLFYFGLDSLRR